MRKIQTRENWETRIKTRFLLFPKAIGKEIRWLEKATWEEEYYKCNTCILGFWESKRWINE